MTYRNDHEALFAYHDSLVRELADVDGKLKSLADAAATRARLAAELARVRADLASRAAKLDPVRLPKVSVAKPCKESWDGMVGDEQVRHCKRCDKLVFNLSEMTAGEAEAVLTAHGTTPCVRFFRRADGTVKTADCPSQRPTWAIAALASGALAAGAAAAAQVFPTAPTRLEPPPPSSGPLMGEMPITRQPLTQPPEPRRPPSREHGRWTGGLPSQPTTAEERERRWKQVLEQRRARARKSR